MKNRIVKLACVFAWTLAGIAYYVCNRAALTASAVIRPADVSDGSEYDNALRAEVEAFKAVREALNEKAREEMEKDHTKSINKGASQ